MRLPYRSAGPQLPQLCTAASPHCSFVPHRSFVPQRHTAASYRSTVPQICTAAPYRSVVPDYTVAQTALWRVHGAALCWVGEADSGQVLWQRISRYFEGEGFAGWVAASWGKLDAQGVGALLGHVGRASFVCLFACGAWLDLGFACDLSAE